MLHIPIDRLGSIPWSAAVGTRLVFRQPVLEALRAAELVAVVALYRVTNHAEAYDT